MYSELILGFSRLTLYCGSTSICSKEQLRYRNRPAAIATHNLPSQSRWNDLLFPGTPATRWYATSLPSVPGMALQSEATAEHTATVSSEHTHHASGTNPQPGCALRRWRRVLQCNTLRTSSFQHPSAEYCWKLPPRMPYWLLPSWSVWQQVLSYPYRILPVLAKYFANFTVLKHY